MYEKYIITGDIIDYYQYEKLNVNSKGGHREKQNSDQTENYKETQRKRRRIIRQLICTNFDNQSKFLTLTFRDTDAFDIKDVKQCNAEYKKFIQRLKYKYPELQYVSVIEFQDKNDRGAVHYHMVNNLPYVKKSELAQIWGLGHVYVNRIDHVDNIGAYVVKYMTVDMDDIRLQGIKAYNCSKDLKRPTEVKSWAFMDRQAIFDLHDMIEKKSPSYESTYESENSGVITYKQYNMNRKS